MKQNGAVAAAKGVEMGASQSVEKTTELDAILNEICATLQLSDAQFEVAKERHREVGEWLTESRGPFAGSHGAVYPQGSMRLRTSVRPRPRHGEEFDLDLVFQVNAPDTTPALLYESVARRLEQHQDFKGRLERKNRCVRLTYTGQFHLDILPARTAPADHLLAVEVPDRERRAWHPSNPEGFAQWFETRCSTARAAIKARAVQPLQEPIDPKLLEPLRRIVQLMKRRRDNWFPDGVEATRSIVLTTLAGQHYSGVDGTTEALSGVLSAINAAADRAEAAGGRLVARNPTRPEEDFSEKWTGDPKSYRASREFLDEFAVEMEDLTRAQGFDEIAAQLNRMFGSELGAIAVKRYMDRLKQAKDTGTIGYKGPAIVIASAASRPIAAHTFHHG